MVKLEDAVEIISALENAGIKVFIDGGWGVDALLGYQSRTHNDIDIFIEQQNKDYAVKLLKKYGYSEKVMEYTTLNHTVWQDDKERIIDLHIFSLNNEDDFVFEGATYPKDVFSGKGQIGGLEVDCIAPEWQIIFHSSYELDDNDIKDVLLLCNRFNIGVPDEIIERIRIASKRLSIRRWSEDDAEALYKYASDGRVSEMALWPRHTSVDMSREVIRDFFKPNPYTFAIVLKETDEPIGCIGLVPPEEEHFKPLANEREVGYWIGFPYWGKGLTTEALSALIIFCQDCLHLDSLLITTDAKNIASQRVAKKCGFNFIAEYTYNDVDNHAYRLSLK